MKFWAGSGAKAGSSDGAKEFLLGRLGGSILPAGALMADWPVCK